MDRVDFGLLVLRVVFGVFLAYHGYNKVAGPGGLKGTTGWFKSIGMRWPRWQARLAAATEIGAGLLFAAGLLTPLAAAGMIALMLVAIVVAHRKVGFFIFKEGQGWEYCASIAVAAFSVATIGPGRASLDHALGWDWDSWAGAIIAASVGVGGAAAHLALSYRPPQAAAVPSEAALP
jgi:putative oxidoreductase